MLVRVTGFHMWLKWLSAQCLPVTLWCRSACLSVCLSVCLPACLPACLSTLLYKLPPLRLSRSFPLCSRKHFTQTLTRQDVGVSAHTAVSLPHLPLVQDGAQSLHRGETFGFVEQFNPTFASFWSLARLNNDVGESLVQNLTSVLLSRFHAGQRRFGWIILSAQLGPEKRIRGFYFPPTSQWVKQWLYSAADCA